MNKCYKIKINTAFSKKRSCFFRQKTNALHKVGNYIKAQNILGIVIYRDTLRVNCPYKHYVQ